MPGMVKLSGWGRHPVVDCAVETPRERLDVEALVRGPSPLIARGNGRSYGDAALNAGLTVSMLSMDRMCGFDPAAGVLTCESGVLLRDILDCFVPRGWMPAVVPGTAWVTVGGMIAADVHGKNHHRDGSFGAHVESLLLLNARGETLHCSRTENSELFRATIGGMGLTGIILSASFRMRRIPTGHLLVETIAAPDLDGAMAVFEASRDWSYSVAWIDCLGRGAGLGRALVSRGRFPDAAEPNPRPGREVPGMRRRARLAMPVDAPMALVNGVSVKAFNTLYYYLGRGRPGLRPVHYDPYFFPLDRVDGWNRIYGRRGFVQYQCVLPKEESPDGLRALLERVGAARTGSFLGVLKLLGPCGDGLMSFPLEGYTLALDFPMRAGTEELLDALDEITHAHGGRVYLAKDACCRPERLRAGYANYDAFQAIRRASEAEGKFTSALAARLGL